MPQTLDISIPYPPNAIAIVVSGQSFTAYFDGDVLPTHLLVQPSEPDWQGFIDIVGLPMLLLLSEITDPLAQQFSGNLKMELNKAPDVNVPWLCLMWNNSISTIAVLPATEQFLNDAATSNNIPLTLTNGFLADANSP